MGIGTSELTLAQLAAFKYSNVNFVNVPGGDLLYTVTGHPKLVIINLGELLNIASGEVQGDAVAIDELEASRIADNAIHGRELAATPGLFHTPTATVPHDHTDTAGVTLLAANAPGQGDRMVLVQCTVTEAWVSTSWEIDVGSTAAVGGLFTDIFDGVADLAIDETVVGAYLLPEGEALVTVENSAVGDTAGILSFAVIVLTPAANSIPGGLLADDAVGDFATSTTVGCAHDAVSPFELLAADAVNDRLVLVMGVATETAAGEPDLDVGSEITDPSGVFDDLAAGAWVIGERWVGACMLPAGEALDATITAAGTGGEIDFHIIPLTVVGSGTRNLLQDPAVAVSQDHGAGIATLLAANAVGGGDRLVFVQAEVTEAFVGTSFEWDVGSGATPAALFDDLFGGTVPTAIGMSLLGAYLLPEGEALVTVLTETTLTAGAIEFRTYVATPAAGSIPGALLANEGVHFPDNVVPTLFTWDGAATQELLAADATTDRIVTVIAICTETAAGGPEIDVGGVAGNEVFDDLAAGAWVAGERYMGTMLLLQDEALNVTLTVGGASAGDINFYVFEVTPAVRTLQIYDDAVTDAKLESAIIKDEGVQAHACLRVTGVTADGETVTIGTDIFEIDPIVDDLGDNTQGNEWNNVTDPLLVTISAANYANLNGVLVLGELVYIGTEYMRVTIIDGDDVTFERGAGGSVIAVHADAVDIFTSAATPAPTDIPVGVQADFSAAVVGPILVATINEDAGTAGQANNVTASDTEGDGSVIAIFADAVGVVALATTDTHGNGVWDFTAMRRGVAEAVRQQANITIEPDAEEVTSGDIFIPLPFAPTVVHVLVIVTATGATKVWDGAVEIVAAAGGVPDYIILDNGAAVDWAETDTIHVVATS